MGGYTPIRPCSPLRPWRLLIAREPFSAGFVDLQRGVQTLVGQDMGNPYEITLKLFHNSAAEYIQCVITISRMIQRVEASPIPYLMFES